MIPVYEGRTAASLIRDLELSRGAACAGCEKPLSSHEVLMAIAVGFKNGLRCLPCLGAALECEVAQIRESLMAFIQQRECYAEAWRWANREAGTPEESRFLASDPPGNAPSEKVIDPILSTTASWDAGDLGCGELVLELRVRLEKLAPGEIFELTARDPGAREDMPAWCRLTGHTLERAEHPRYWIQRKG